MTILLQWIQYLARAASPMLILYFLGAPNFIKADPSTSTAFTGTAAAIRPDVLQRASEVYSSIVGYPYELNINRHRPYAANGQPITARFKPYSGSWYRETLGGTNIHGALDRYDAAFNAKAAEWERTYHTRSRSSSDADWAGHCNGFAAAASRHKEPPQSVRCSAELRQRTGIPCREGAVFSRSDIKALMAEIYMNAIPVNLGGERCEQKKPGLNPFNRPDKTQLGSCEDVNAAAFHLALINWLGGPENLPIILDRSIDYQVWNYPVYAYQCVNCINGQWKMLNNKEEALNIIAGGTRRDSYSQYIFNPEADRFAHVQMKVLYVDAADSEILNTTNLQDVVFEYILELNKNGDVIGGEWAYRSQAYEPSRGREGHPDFVWIALEAKPGTGDPRFSNPELNVDYVLELWRESLRLQGELKPYEGKNSENWKPTWGQLGDMNVLINDDDSGAVFLGRPTQLKLMRLTDRLAQSPIEIWLNKKSIYRFSWGNHKERALELTPQVGLNELVFAIGGTGGEIQRTVYFYAMP